MTKILEIKTTDNKGIIEYNAKIKVMKSGAGAGITLPKQLLGKVVRVIYKREGKRK